VRGRIWRYAAVLLALGLPPGASGKSENEAKSELARVEARIREVTQTVHAEASRRDAVANALEEAEGSLVDARGSLAGIREKSEASAVRLKQLRAEESRVRHTLDEERSHLAEQLRSAYESGQAENLRLLLSADDPAELGRTVAYFGYLGRARVAKMAQIKEELARLEAVEQAANEEAERLASLVRDEAREVDSLGKARARREHALAALKAEIDTKNTELKRLKGNAEALEGLIAKLDEALRESAPEDYAFDRDRREPFVRVRGRLPWPTRGKLEERYGDSHGAGLRSQGWLLGTAPGAPVRAPYYGRVVYADWLPGLGLLLILDHGDGYLSLYGHNESLYRKVGEAVTPGTLLAAAGKGPPEPQLYFEIRHGTKTLDPAEWLKKASPR
jgi:murein hydrolase activator